MQDAEMPLSVDERRELLERVEAWFVTDPKQPRRPVRDIRMPPHIEASYTAAREARELALTLQPLDVAGADAKALRAFRRLRPDLEHVEKREPSHNHDRTVTRHDRTLTER